MSNAPINDYPLSPPQSWLPWCISGDLKRVFQKPHPSGKFNCQIACHGLRSDKQWNSIKNASNVKFKYKTKRKWIRKAVVTKNKVVKFNLTIWASGQVMNNISRLFNTKWLKSGQAETWLTWPVATAL